MDCGEAESQRLFGGKEVAKVSAGIVFAGRAGAGGID